MTMYIARSIAVPPKKVHRVSARANKTEPIKSPSYLDGALLEAGGEELKDEVDCWEPEGDDGTFKGCSCCASRSMSVKPLSSTAFCKTVCERYIASTISRRRTTHLNAVSIVLPNLSAPSLVILSFSPVLREPLLGVHGATATTLPISYGLEIAFEPGIEAGVVRVFERCALR